MTDNYKNKIFLKCIGETQWKFLLWVIYELFPGLYFSITLNKQVSGQGQERSDYIEKLNLIRSFIYLKFTFLEEK